VSRYGIQLKDVVQRSSLRTVVFSAVAVTLLLVATVFAVLTLDIAAQNGDELKARRSAEALQAATASEASVIDLETGLRGYMLTGRRNSLEPYLQARAALEPQLAHLVVLSGEDPTQQVRARGIAKAVESYERSYAARLAAGNVVRTRAETLTVTSDGKRLLDPIRARYAVFEHAELLRSSERSAAAASRRHVVLTAVTGCFIAVALLLLALTAYLARAVLMPMRRAAQAAERLSEGDLDSTVPEGGLGEVRALARAFNSMSATLHDRELALRVTTGQFQGILDNANAAIYIKDSAGRYLLVNREFERIRGVKAEDVLGNTEYEFGAADFAEETAARDHAVIEAGEPVAFEQVLALPDGVHTYLSVKFPIQVESVTTVAGISTDITAQRHALAQAVETSRLQSEFVANMSHEMRTPLAVVVGMTTLLHDTSLDPAQHEYADALASSSEALMSVINDVLDFSKLEAGQLQLDPTDFELRGAVEEACLMLAEQAHVTGLEISHWVDAGVPTTVNGDRARLRQILLNLLSNAIKFTRSGEVVVRVLGGGGELVRFEVSDTGVGIGDDQAAHIFDAFVQADQSTTRQYGGTGLGLTISRELTHRMGGEIGAKPRVGGGSVFWFTANLPASASTDNAVQARPTFAGLRALIVDDNATSRGIFAHYLMDWGVACESVDKPAAAIEALERAFRDGQPFELALIDFDVPHINGMELVRAIRKRAALDSLRIVIVASSPLEREALVGVEVSGVLTKPIRQARLHDAIAGRRAQPEAESQTTLVEPDGPLLLIAEDNELHRAMATALLAKHGLRTAVARNGREAVEMALANTYSAILMDAAMPVLDGYEATRRIRAAENGHRIPIIATTAHSMPGDRERCLAAGMDDYLSKPIQAEQLETVIKRWLPDRRPGIGPRRAMNDGTSGSERGDGDVADVLNQATIIELRKTLNLEMREDLIRTFVTALPKSVADIEDAVHRGDEGELRRTTRLLRQSSATVGATRLRLCCQQIERSGRRDDAGVSEDQLAQLLATATRTRDALREQLL